MAGLKKVWGCEIRQGNVRNAKTAIERVYQSMVCPHYLLASTLTLVHADVKHVARLPADATVIFCFWEANFRDGESDLKKKIGELASKCPGFRMLCVVQSGRGWTKESLAEHVHEDCCFPKMTCAWNGPVRMSNDTFQAFILTKM